MKRHQTVTLGVPHLALTTGEQLPLSTRTKRVTGDLSDLLSGLKTDG